VLFWPKPLASPAHSNYSTLKGHMSIPGEVCFSPLLYSKSEYVMK